MNELYRREAFAAIYGTMAGLAAVGVLGQRTMKAFYEMCLDRATPLSVDAIGATSICEQASRAAFAWADLPTGTRCEAPTWRVAECVDWKKGSCY